MIQVRQGETLPGDDEGVEGDYFFNPNKNTGYIKVRGKWALAFKPKDLVADAISLLKENGIVPHAFDAKKHRLEIGIPDVE